MLQRLRKRSASMTVVEKGVKKNESHGSNTYLAFSTDCADVQPLLPQVLLGNKRRFTPALVQAARVNLPTTVHMMRERSSWATCDVMMRCLEPVSSPLQSVSAKFQSVLLVDTARAHLGLEVFRRAAELNTWVIIILAGLTWLLQPLEVCCFGSCKRHLQDEYCRACSAKGKDL